MKLLLALFVVAMAGYCKGQWGIGQQIADVVNRNRAISTGNAEFTQKIEELFYVNREPDHHAGELKMRHLSYFNAYNAERQALESRMTKRIDTINSKLASRKLNQECRNKLQAQKHILSKSYQFSNAEKERILESNSKDCKRPDWYDYDDDDDFYY